MDNIEQEEFELGENVTDQVRRGKPSGVVVSVRLSPEDAASLMDLAEESGRTVSQVARQAIRYFLSEQRGQLAAGGQGGARRRGSAEGPKSQETGGGTVKDETGQPIVCIHCGEQAVSYNRVLGFPVCWRHLQPAIYAATAESLGRVGLAGPKESRQRRTGGNHGER